MSIGRENEFVDPPPRVRSIAEAPALVASWAGVQALLRAKGAPPALMHAAANAVNKSSEIGSSVTRKGQGERYRPLTEEEIEDIRQRSDELIQRISPREVTITPAERQQTADELAAASREQVGRPSQDRLAQQPDRTEKAVAEALNYTPGPRRIVLPEKPETRQEENS